MINPTPLPRRHQELLRVVRSVRARWRMRILLKGVAIVAAAALFVFAASAFGLEQARFSPGAIATFRWVTYLSLVGLGLWYVVRPLLRRVSDEQVALYLEEHEPTLGQAVVSAIDMGSDRQRSAVSEALAAGLVEQAIEGCRRVEGGRAIERLALYRSSGALAAIAIAALLIFQFGPAYLRHGASALLLPTKDAESLNPYSLDVLPGDVTIARGSDQAVQAHPVGFASEDVMLFHRPDGETEYKPLPMIPADSVEFEALLFGVAEGTDYFVESNGVRSRTFRIEVEDLPYVDELELEYRFPSYTGLSPQVVENGGDVAVLKGTEVVLRITPTMPTPAGDLILDDSTRVALEVSPEGLLTGSFPVVRPGFYRVELQSPRGVMVKASAEYTIDVLDDQPPSVKISKPGRDTRASPIEEVYIEAEAEDDYGIGSLEVVYSVNGGVEQTVSLFGGGSRPLTEVSAGHTFFLEEYELEPGDVISYYARAVDNDRVNGRKDVTSDMYFLQIRPFQKDYTQAEQAGGPPQGGGGGGPESALSEQQRQVISATFNLVRDREKYSTQDFGEFMTTIRLMQGRLKDEVEQLMQRMNERGVAADPGFEIVAKALPEALIAMSAALDTLGAERPKQALPDEQRALQHLLRAEEAFREVQVQMQQQGGGGGGGGSTAEDLADLFELELDKLKNQYETVERGQEQQAEQEVDEALERLKELARRQEQAAERQRRRAAQNPGGGGGGDASQRELADETEEAARELERLARENRNQKLEETARQLQEAADAMRRSASRTGNDGASQARDALERLREARRLLEREQSDRLGDGAEEAQDRARELAQQQEQIQKDMGELSSGDQANFLERARRLMEQKQEMEAGIQDLERQLDRLADEANRDGDQREAGRAMEEAAEFIRESKLRERVQYTRGTMGQRIDPVQEGIIGENLDELADRVAKAAGQITEGDGERASEALDQTRDLVRGLESMDERLRQSGEEAEEGRRLGQRSGQDGQQGEEQGEQSGEQSGEQAGQEGEAGQQAGQEGQQAGQEGQQAGREGGQAGREGQAGGQQGGQAQGGQQTGAGPGGSGVNRQGGQGAPLTDQQIRQMRAEARARAAEAEDLRRTLSGLGEETAELDQVIRSLRALDDARAYRDIEEIQRLQAAILEGAKAFEFGLRRSVEGEGDNLLLSGSGDVPPGYEKMIEEYYKALAKGRGSR